MQFSFFLFLFILFFTGCGSSSSDGITLDTKENLYHEQWYMDKETTFYTLNQINTEAHIHPDENTYTTYTGNGVKIAIIDDGFDINHPEIKDKIIATSFVNEYGAITTDISHSDETDHHGTAVAGIIGAKDNGTGVRGIAPNAQLILIKMPDLFTDSIVIKLFEEAIRHGADIINCSWGTGKVSQPVEDYINYIARTAREGKGITIIFAAGNGDKEIEECNSLNIKDDESGIENVIGVGATDGNNLRTCYSNYGALLDIVAPGGYDHSIATIDPLGKAGVTNDGYNRYNQLQDKKWVGFIGTSASAPILTGSVALLLEKYPNLTSEQIQEKLKSATDTIGQNTPYIYDMVHSNSQNPIINGIYGTNLNSTFKVKLTSQNTSLSYGPYSVTSGINNTWNSTVTNTLPNGNYTIDLVDDDGETIWATDDKFTIDTTLSYIQTNTQKMKSNYYGYGKINLSKLLQ